MCRLLPWFPVGRGVAATALAIVLGCGARTVVARDPELARQSVEVSNPTAPRTPEPSKGPEVPTGLPDDRPAKPTDGPYGAAAELLRTAEGMADGPARVIKWRGTAPAYEDALMQAGKGGSAGTPPGALDG